MSTVLYNCNVDSAEDEMLVYKQLYPDKKVGISQDRLPAVSKHEQFDYFLYLVHFILTAHEGEISHPTFHLCEKSINSREIQTLYGT